MKRTQLLEWGIITIALIFGYKFFENLFAMILQMIYAFIFRNAPVSGSILGLLAATVIYATGFILLIKSSHRIAAYFDKPDSNETISIKINKRSLLQIILIGICFTTILANIGNILIYLFESFKEGVGGYDPFEDRNPAVSEYGFIIAAARTVIAVIVLFYSKSISHWFVQKNLVDELVFETGPEK